MKIYQLHEYGGEWEDAYDYIIGSYCHKECAEEKLAAAEKTEEERRQSINRCRNCPLITSSCTSLESLKRESEAYCERASIVLNEEIDLVYCNNYDIYDDKFYRIEEVEVEE